MGKVIFWIFVIFVALFLLRLYNVHQQNKRKKEEAGADGADGANPPHKSATGEAMVRCARCGIFLPRSEALLIGGTPRCRDRECATHAR